MTVKKSVFGGVIPSGSGPSEIAMLRKGEYVINTAACKPAVYPLIKDKPEAP